VAFRRFAALVAVVALPLAAGACSSETKDSAKSDVQSAVSDANDAAANVLDNATETAIRNVATQQGEEQFTNSKNPLDDQGLTCEAKMADGVAHVAVSCTGTTKDGKPAALNGETSQVPGASITHLEGTFTGTVDGSEVFTTEKLGG
jgi:hypothetical protein